MEIYRNYLLFIFLLTLFSCTRHFSDNTTKVQFSFPQAITQKSSSKTTILENASRGTSNFAGPAATNIDEITCYYVLVSGPEDSLKTNTCEIKKSTGSYKAAYGIIAGGILAGNSIEISIPSGNDRVISLIGFRSSDVTYCPPVKTMDQSLLSNPYFLGEVGHLKLEPGARQNVPIKMNLDPSNYIGDCQGPDFGGGSGGGGSNSGPILAEPDQISTFMQITSNHITQDYCFPFSIELKKAGSMVNSLTDKLLTITKNSQLSYNVTTLAGLASNVGSTDATGSAARFNNPMGVLIDNMGNLIVADTGNHTIRKITPAGTVTTLAGVAGTAGSTDAVGMAAKFSSPTGLAMDSSGNIYIADSGNHTIRKMTPAGVVSTFAGIAGSSGLVNGTGASSKFNSPQGIAIDSSGNLYVADSANHLIRKITSAGVVTTFAGSGTPGSIDAVGVAASFNQPLGVATDNTGNVYVADQANHLIRKISSSQVVTTLAGTPGSSGNTDGPASSSTFYFPRRVTVDSSGNVYVADNQNHSIRKITSGSVNTFAGVNGSSGSIDATAPSSLFSYPSGITTDVSGTIYVADSGNNTIRKISGTSLNSNMRFYNSLSDCNSSLNETSTYSIPAGEGRRLGFFKSQSPTATNESFSLKDSASVMTDSALQPYIVQMPPTGYADSLKTLIPATGINFTNYSCFEGLVYGFSNPYSTAAKIGPTGLTITPTYTGSGSIFFTSDCSNKTVVPNYSIPSGAIFTRFGVWTNDLTNPWSGTVTLTPSGAFTSPSLTFTIYH